MPLAIAACTARPPAPAATPATTETATLVPTGTPSLMPAGTPKPADSATPTVEPTAADDDGPSGDLGLGETMLIVVGSTYASQAEAEAAAAEPLLGDVQGYYVDISDNYRLVEACEPQGPGAPQLSGDTLDPGQWLMLTAFRTETGALDWLEAMEGAMTDFGEPSILLVEKTGGPYVGLGQESDPRGGGPLAGPLPEPPDCP